jgi:PadR family transcriptional regulator PadR
MPTRRASLAKVKVLGALLQDPTGPHWGYRLLKETGVRSGSLYPILAQLTRDGWLRCEWEVLSNADAGRPPRRTYYLTGLGARAAAEELARFASEVARVPGLAAGEA